MEHIKEQLNKGGKPPLFKDGKLDYRQDKAAILLSLDYKRKKVADEVNISLRQLKRWIDKKVFKERVDYWRKKFIGLQVKKITKDMIDVKEMLYQTVDDGMKAPATRDHAIRAGGLIVRMEGKTAPREIKRTPEYKEFEKLSEEELNKQFNELLNRRENSNVDGRAGRTKKEGDKEMPEG